MKYLSLFFNSFVGMYMAQSFCHSVVAAIITDRAMKSWRIQDPLLRQRFRLAVILIPVFSYPLYQLINPARSSPQFRLDALFDINRWLALEIWGSFPIGMLFIFMLAGTGLVFLLQEMIPVISHTVGSRQPKESGKPMQPDMSLTTTARALSLDTPRVYILADDDPVLFSTTGRDAVIYISSYLERSLTPDQLHAALAHELAHIARNRRPLLAAVFVLRIIMFFNPVVLVKFRHAVRDEEKICDDMAVSLTGHREALALALENFLQRPPEAPGLERQSLQAFTSSLEEQSHYEHVQSRIARLRQGSPGTEAGMPALVLAIVVTVVLNYFIV
jgi:Zn-dependent protease with chaperone function